MARLDSDELKPKTTKELLILIAQHCNDITGDFADMKGDIKEDFQEVKAHLAKLNNSVAKNTEGRLTNEARLDAIEKAHPITPAKPRASNKFNLNWSAITVISLALAIAFLEVGQIKGWW